MKIFFVGTGGREHALMLKALAEGHEVFAFGGENAGMSACAKCTMISGKPTDIHAVVKAALEVKPDLVIVGPEDPLALGLVDACRQVGLAAFGPTKAAAKLEASKLFAKEVMAARNVPTAPYWVFTDDQIDQVRAQAKAMNWQCVFKADGLVAGKGVTVCRNESEVEAALQRFFVDHEFGDQGRTVLIEEILIPDPRFKRAEFSELYLVDAHGNVIPLMPSQDHKPVYDGDQGLNTGGMGAYTSPPWLTKEMRDRVRKEIIEPVVAEMQKRNTPFTGVLYAGLMLTKDGPKVVEFNVRFGDPEIQAVLAMLENDLMPVLLAIANGESIKDVELKWKSGNAVCLVLASDGYPKDGYVKGLKIEGLLERSDEETTIIIAGAKYDAEGNLVTSGGRVANIVVTAASLEEAAGVAFVKARKVTFGGKPPHFRTDIGLGA